MLFLWSAQHPILCPLLQELFLMNMHQLWSTMKVEEAIPRIIKKWGTREGDGGTLERKEAGHMGGVQGDFYRLCEEGEWVVSLVFKGFWRGTIDWSQAIGVETAQVCFPLFSVLTWIQFLIILYFFFSIYFADWSGHQGPLICFSESKLFINLPCYGSVLGFFYSSRK